MASTRRNTISYTAERAIAGVAAAAAVVAAFSGASPTGDTVVDIVLVGAFAAFVTWTAASAPWWALTAAAGLAVAGALPGPLLLVLVVVAAALGATWIGWNRANQAIARAVIGAAVVQVALRFEWDPFFLASALLAAAATGTIAVNGVLRRRKYLRKRVYIGVGAMALIAVAAIGAMGFAAVQARTTARDGYTGMLDGLEFVQDGRIPEAAEALRQASADLDSAGDDLGGPLSQLARVVPGLAQNRNGAADVLARAADAAASAADTLDVVDLDQLTVSGGFIDVFAFASLEAPLADLDATIAELDDALQDARSPWLVAPFADRLDNAIDRADQVAHQATATAAAARVAPAMLGADEPRRYFLAFVNPAEARGHSGLMGNWNEITITGGRIQVTAEGRTNDLQDEALRDLYLDATDEYIARYSYFGARASRGVAVKYWSNVTMSADMPSAGNAMAQMYEQVTGRAIDGVFVIDPAGIARLIEITGPIDLPEIDRRIDANNAEQFLVLDQYEFAENEREDLLTSVTEQTIERVLSGTLPPPQRMAPILAPAVLNGHISGWAVRPEEQELFALVGMDAALPTGDRPGLDAIAIANNNAGGNKIDSFLHRTIEYRPVVDQRTGIATATLRVTFENDAPTSGLTDYVIGGLAGDPIGTNRMIVDVYTRLGVTSALVDGEQLPSIRNPELGYDVYSVTIVIPPGDAAVLEMELAGNLAPGDYQLAYRPQPLPNDDQVIIEARSTNGDRLFDFDGVLERRSLLSPDSVEAWR